jgi:hypothetical protein
MGCNRANSIALAVVELWELIPPKTGCGDESRGWLRNLKEKTAIGAIIDIQFCGTTGVMHGTTVRMNSSKALLPEC